MQPSIEMSIDLTTQELLESPSLSDLVEVDDIGDIDPLLRTGSFVANADQTGATSQIEAAADETSVEIELTAEQIDALLSLPCIK